jgi:SH3-like domain-containing protein
MKTKILIVVIAISSIFTACTRPDTSSASSQLDTLNAKLDELKKSEGFDKREEIFDYQLDTNATNEVVFSVRTTDESFSQKAVAIAKSMGIEQSNITQLPDDPQLLDTPFGVVSQSVANMRVGQSRTKGMATQTLMGMQLELLEVDEEGFWHRVRNAQGYIAWIPKPSFEYLSRQQADSLRSLPKVMVTAHTTFAYQVDNSQRVVTDLVYGNVLTLVKKGQEWTEIMIPGGRRALVASSEIMPLEMWQQKVHFDPQHLVDFAYTFNGQPYLWGGNSLKGVDCSGFSGAVYYSMGQFLPRDASQQIKQGDEVNYTIETVSIDGETFSKMVTDELEVGDLLFFGNKEKGSVTHVGIWIGNDEYIHSSGRVHVSSVDPARENYKGYLVETLVGVRRIYKSENLEKTIDLTATHIWY